MENSAKALLISAGVLLAILLLSLFTYIMRQMGESTTGIYSTLSQHEISEYNQKFLNYEGRGVYSVGKDQDGNDIYNPLTVQDVVTLINLARDSKNNVKYLNEVKITKGTDNLANSQQNYIEFMKANPEKLYKCIKVNISQTTMLVNEVIIQEY